MKRLLIIATTVLLAACGGGGGGSTAPVAVTPTPTPVTCTAPQVLTNGACVTPTYTVGGTVTGLTPGTQVTLQNNGGDAVTVSADGTFVFATAVAAKAAFSASVGTQPAAGSCSVTGGTGAVGSSAVTDVVVSCVDPCSPVIANLTYPNSYSGVFTLPTPTQKLPAGVVRGMGLKDYYPGNPTGKISCNNTGTVEAHAAYIATLDKIKADGTDTVWVYNYGVWDDITQPVYSIPKSTMQISDSEMTFLVSEATKKNLKVFVTLQFSAYDLNGKTLPFGTKIPTATLQSMLASYKKWAVEYATFSQSIGVSGFSSDWNAFFVAPDTAAYNEAYMASMLDITKSIKAVFKGKIVYGENNNLVDSRFEGYVDYLKMMLANPNPTLTDAENKNLTVAAIKDRYTSQIANYYQYGPVNIPVIFDVLVESKYDFFVNGWTEDGFCVNNCIQNTYVTDFSVQAIGIEAALEAVSSQTTVKSAGTSIVSAYWLSDTMVPVNDNVTANTGFPNQSESVRNKPAEGIIKYWYTP